MEDTNTVMETENGSPVVPDPEPALIKKPKKKQARAKSLKPGEKYHVGDYLRLDCEGVGKTHKVHKFNWVAAKGPKPAKCSVAIKMLKKGK